MFRILPEFKYTRTIHTNVRGDVEVADAGAIVRDGARIFILVLLWVLFWPFYSVPTGSRGVVTQFGKIVGIEGEGLTVLPPWRRLTNFSVRSEAANIENAEGSTSDTQPVHVSMTVRYNISPAKVAEVYEQYSHDGDLSNYVQTATQEIFKAVTARYTAPELIGKRALVSHDIFLALQDKLTVYGAHVINIDMRNFTFSNEYMGAINQKVTQEQLRLAAENKFHTVEAEQKQKVAVATAESNAVKAKADGDAYAVLTNATAEAKAVQLKGEAQAKAMEAQATALIKNPVLVEMRKAESWDGKLPQAVYAGAPIPFFNATAAK